MYRFLQGEIMSNEYMNLVRKINQCKSILHDVKASKENEYKKELLEDLLVDISWMIFDLAGEE